MKTREAVLAFLEAHRGAFFSGERLAEELAVSRTSVWKAVKSLQAEGYAITAVTNRGYCLSEETDILSVQGIRKYLRGMDGRLRLQVHPVVTSTNTLVREQAAAGEPEGLVILANRQTAGRGRVGRSFFSPEDTGLYLSLLLRPEQASQEQALKLTTKAAVAMSRAIEEVTGAEAGIKWVNDLFVRGRKVCGILTEGSFNFETGLLDYAVVGLGVNVYPPEGGFPEAITQTAGCVCEQRGDDIRNRLAAAFLEHFFPLCSAADDSYVEEYRARSIVIGREVTVLSGDTSEEVTVTGIDERCRLLVRRRDGTKAALQSGEISIRL